jgi:4,5-dihydroxyphthalate decarboxylase
LGADPWEYGLSDRNRHTLATLAGYSQEQGLTKRLMSLDDLFVHVSQGRKRGDEFRI